MTKNQRNVAIGVAIVITAAAVLRLPQCKGLCRTIAAQAESFGVADVLTGLFG